METVVGPNLQRVLRTEGSLASTLARSSVLQRRWFTMKVLHSLVMHPEDDKADNVSIAPSLVATRSLPLISFDMAPCCAHSLECGC